MKKVFIIALISFLILPITIYLLLKENIFSEFNEYAGAILTYCGTVFLGGITVWQQYKYAKLAEEKDLQQQKNLKEEQRLSFLPYFTSLNKEILLSDINNKEAIIDFQNNKEYTKECIPELKETLKTLNQENVVYIEYTIQNLGRDTALYPEIQIEPFKKPVSAISKSESRTYILKIDCSKLENKTFEIKLFFSSLDNNKYYQGDKFNCVTTTEYGNNNFKISKERISEPELFNKQNK